MIVNIHSNNAYLSVPGAKSRIGGHFYFGNKDRLDDEYDGAVRVECSVLKPVVVSVAEGETASFLVNCQK